MKTKAELTVKFKKHFEEIYNEVIEELPDTAERNMLLTRFQEAIFWFGAALEKSESNQDA